MLQSSKPLCYKSVGENVRHQ